jgi:phosphatidate cytidylyltransferase
MSKAKDLLAKSFTQRLLSALAALLLFFASVYFFETTGLYILSSLIVLLMSYEVFNLCLKSNKLLFSIFFVFRCFWFLWALRFFNLNFLCLFAFLDVFTWLLYERFQSSKIENDKVPKSGRHEAILCFNFYSLIAPTLCLSHLKPELGGILSLFTLLFIVFSFDSFSYFCGKALGGRFFKSKLYPKASPSKTIEGALGGLFVTSCVVLLIRHLRLFRMPQFEIVSPNNHIALFALVVVFCIFSLCGDLLESLLKRSAQVKDSGSIMPGHGGIFDRLDGVLVASVFSYFLLSL